MNFLRIWYEERERGGEEREERGQRGGEEKRFNSVQLRTDTMLLVYSIFGENEGEEKEKRGEERQKKRKQNEC